MSVAIRCAAGLAGALLAAVVRAAANAGDGWNTRAMGERLAAYRSGRGWSGELLPLQPPAERGP